jgi:hypothetical protein
MTFSRRISVRFRWPRLIRATRHQAALVIETLAGRLTAVSPCTPAARRVLELFRLPLLDYWLARHSTVPGPVMGEQAPAGVRA